MRLLATISGLSVLAAMAVAFVAYAIRTDGLRDAAIAITFSVVTTAAIVGAVMLAVWGITGDLS